MDRNLYLQLCQRCSLFSTGILKAKENVPDELKVIYKGIVYYPHAYEMSFKNGETINTAILHDLKANSVTYAELSKVDKYLKL